MRIALITPSVFPCLSKGYGGVERICYNLGTELSRLGHEVTLIAPRGSQTPPKGELIETIDPPMRWTGGEEKKAFETYKDKLTEFDIIHSHDHEKWAYIAKKERPKLKVIGTLHGIQTWRTLPPVRYPNLVAISDWQVQDMLKRYGYRCRRVYHGINLDRYPYVEEKEDYFLSFGLMASHKGHHISTWLARKLGVKVYIAGEDSFVPNTSYVRYVRSLEDLPHGIQYWGKVKERIAIRLLSKAKAVILPFLMDEAFALVAVEAMACGTPVITFNRGAMKEIIEHEVTGYVVDTLDEMEEVVRKIDDIWPSSCRARVERMFTSKIMAKHYVSLYETILEGSEW